jgi:hypothetical protein
MPGDRVCSDVGLAGKLSGTTSRASE